MAAYNSTIYTDPEDNQKPGFIINGKTYQDPGGTIPVEVGSKVTSADGRQWYKGENGSVEITPGSGAPGEMITRQQQTAELAKDSLNSARREQEQLIQARTDSAVAQLRAQIDPLNQSYDKQKTANYRSYVTGQLSLNDQLAQAGLSTSGASESSRIRMDADYGGLQNETELARQNALQGLQEQITQARLSGDFAMAEQLAGYYQQLAALQQSTAADERNAYLTAYQLKQDAEDRAYQKDMDAKQWEHQLTREGIEDARYKDDLAYSRSQTSRTASAGTKPYAGLSPHTQTLLSLWQQNPSMPLEENLKAAMNSGLISQRDYVAALQIVGALGGGTKQQTAQRDTSAYIRSLGGSYTESQLKQMLAAGKIRILRTDGNGNPMEFEWSGRSASDPAHKRGEMTR